MLGSTRGTDLQAIIDAIENKRLLGVKVIIIYINHGEYIYEEFLIVQ